MPEDDKREYKSNDIRREESFFIFKIRYRCADCDWSSRWGSRAELKFSLEKHTNETGHEYFFTDSSGED